MDFPSGLHADPAVFLDRRGRQAARLAARLRVDDEHVLIRGLVDVTFAVPADERDLLAVGRPRGRRFVERAWREDLGLLRRDVEEIEVRPLAAKEPVAVSLEVIAVDDDRLWRLACPSLAFSLSSSAAATAGSGSLTTRTSRLLSGAQA